MSGSRKLKILSEEDKAFIGLYESVIADEYKKGENERDYQLIKQCADGILDIRGVDCLSEDEITKRINALKVKSAGKNRIRWRSLTAAALVACLLITGCVAVYAASPSFRAFISEFLSSSEGTVMELNGVTYINNGESEQYDTIDELMREERLEILYPARLPDGIFIEKITVSEDSSGKTVLITFNNGNYSMVIENFTEEYDIPTGYIEVYEDFRLYEISGNEFMGLRIDENTVYSVIAPSLDDLKMIIENLR